MWEDAREVAEWLRKALDPAEQVPDGRPPRLAGASVYRDAELRHSVRVNCADGARFGVAVFQLKFSPAQREAADRWFREHRISQEYPGWIGGLVAEMREMTLRTHAEEHNGPFDSCPEETCLIVREGEGRSRGDDAASSDEPGR